jgi:hypothetical protein
MRALPWRFLTNNDPWVILTAALFAFAQLMACYDLLFGAVAFPRKPEA